MAALVPMALWGLEVPCGDFPIPGKPDIPSAFRITMAAIDPSAEAEDLEEGQRPRATLKIMRVPLEEDDFDDEDDSEDDEDDFDIEDLERRLADAEDDDEDEDDEDEDEDEEVNGAGPSDPKKTKQARKAAAEAEIIKLLAEDGMDVDGDAKTNGVFKSAKAKGKMPASDEEDDDEDSDEDDEEEGEIEEFVLCTLDPEKHYQQPLDITIGENERVWFQVSGTHTIYLTGNYVDLPNDRDGMFDPDDDEENDYDLEPDSDELDDYDEDDELDDLEDPRIMEIEEDEEAPKLVAAADKKKPAVADKKANKKRAAEEPAEEAQTLDEMITDAATNGDAKLSKKQLKKMKKNDGSAVAVEKSEEKVEAPASNKSDKKVSFAKNLEQGPTPTKNMADGNKPAEKEKAKTGGAKVVQGVTIDDRKTGTGPAAKKGDRIGMRYIGKLTDGKVFDSNKKGKPFGFKLGVGEVIKGWDIGVQGMSVGGERRITIPAHLAYGSKGVPGIPGNSTLIFDVKLLELNKGK